MRLAFHFEPFDVDVSSGTIHAAHQWHELLMAFGIAEAFVVNTSGMEFPQVNDSLVFHEVESVESIPGPLIVIEQGNNPNHRGYIFPDDATICIGGAYGVPMGLNAEYLSIPTPAALYSREAAAIVLEEQWQLRL